MGGEPLKVNFTGLCGRSAGCFLMAQAWIKCSTLHPPFSIESDTSQCFSFFWPAPASDILLRRAVAEICCAVDTLQPECY